MAEFSWTILSDLSLTLPGDSSGSLLAYCSIQNSRSNSLLSRGSSDPSLVFSINFSSVYLGTSCSFFGSKFVVEFSLLFVTGSYNVSYVLSGTSCIKSNKYITETCQFEKYVK